MNVNKAHGHDNISIRIIKIFGKSICKPLELIFRNSLAVGKFPQIWKKANVIPIHKKNEKNLLKNYRPISLLPICSKIFERLIFNSIYNYISKNNLLSSLALGLTIRAQINYFQLLITFLKIIFSHLISLDLGLVIRAQINYFQLLIIFIHLLMTIVLLKQEEYF